MKFYATVLLAVFLSLAAFSGEEEAEEEAPPTPADIPARIEEAEVGEWALYRKANGDRLRLTVIRKDEYGGDCELVILNEHIPAKKNKRVTRSEEIVSRKEAAAEIRGLGEEDRLSRGAVLVNGRKVNSIIVHHVEDGRVVRQSYLSGGIPVYGLVRGVERSGNETRTVLSLIDYGFSTEEVDY